MESYKVLNKQQFNLGDYYLVPIRYIDRYLIMNWRNDQLFHLRQKEPLTKEIQDQYFKEVVNIEKTQNYPDQILFSLLRNDKCVGYGGLVHIDWLNKNAEISFVIETYNSTNNFVSIWVVFLTLLKQIAFKEISLHKIYTYAFDLRPKLYEALTISGFSFEGRLKDHVLLNSDYYDVVYYSLINPLLDLNIRDIKESDFSLLLNWRNDEQVLKNSFDSNIIDEEEHRVWFNFKLSDTNTKVFIFETKQNKPIGQVRLEKENDQWLIDYSVDSNFRGIGLGFLILNKVINFFGNEKFIAKVKSENTASIKTFEKLGFELALSNNKFNKYFFSVK